MSTQLELEVDFVISFNSKQYDLAFANVKVILPFNSEKAFLLIESLWCWTLFRYIYMPLSYSESFFIAHD